MNLNQFIIKPDCTHILEPGYATQSRSGVVVMFGFIKNLFGGIMAFFGGIFGGSKKSKADEAVAPKAKKGSNGFYMELSDAKPAEPAKSKPVAQAAPVQADAPKPEAVPAAAAPAPKAQSAKKAKSEPKPEPAKEPAPVAANTNGKVKSQPKPVVNFATDYLISTASSNGRRRPGANMSSFLEMARQMK